MLLVVEVPKEAKAVELVIGIGIIQLLEEFQLFQPSLLPIVQKFEYVVHQCKFSQTSI